MTFAVEFSAVSRLYGQVKAVDRVTLRIEQSEFFSMLGPSGSGKTTCLRLMAGFEQPDLGVVRLGGIDAGGLPPYLRDVNTVFQDYALFPHLSVAENVAYGGAGSLELAVQRRHRLLTTAQVDDGQAAMAQGGVIIDIIALLVRAAMK